ncbi:Arc family DNA-binding protein [Acinetobacter baumannii]|nr:Arc family DNA-binding protein [Acinetobacter baumannii]QBY16344.1 Arc family DNA-binding protein [Acinetobacter baumannii]
MADVQFNLRIPEKLKDKIKGSCIKNGRSINAEAQMRLEQVLIMILKWQ